MDPIYYLELVILTTILLVLLSVVVAWTCGDKGKKKAGRQLGPMRARLRQPKIILLLLWVGYAVFMMFLLLDTDLTPHWRATYDAWRLADADPAEVEAGVQEGLRWSGWWVIFGLVAAAPLLTSGSYYCHKRGQLGPYGERTRFWMLLGAANILAGYLAFVALMAVFAPAWLNSWAATLNTTWEPMRELFPGT